MNEINFGFIDSLYLKFLGVPATEAQKLALGFTMETEGLSERQTIIRFVEDNVPNSLFHEYYLAFPDATPTIDELTVWTVSQEKTDDETLQLVSLIAFDFYAVAVNNIGEAVEFTNASSIPASENQISTGLQVAVGTVENITYSLIETLFGVDSSLFTIDPVTGITSFKDSPNFEDPQDSDGDNSYQITVVASNALTKKDIFQNISIIVNDANDAPIVELNQSADYQENKRVSDALITVAASDEDGSIAGFSILSGNTDGFFSIDNLGNISLTSLGINSVANNFESVPNNFTLSVTATDDQGLTSDSTEINLKVINKEERVFTLIGSTEVTEGLKANYRVVLTGGDMSADSSVILSLVLSNGTALNPADFGDLSQIDSTNHTVTLSGPFNEGDTIIEFDLQTVADNLIEGDEDFSVELTSAIIEDNAATVSGFINTTIIDNDFLSFTLTGASTVIEGNSANYQIQLNGGNIAAGSTVVLSLVASNGTAINPADFGDLVQVNSATNTLTLTGPFNDGDIVANINLLTVADTVDEGNESFSVSLTSATIDGSVATALGNVNTTILDDDGPLTFTLTGDTSVTEGDTANYDVILTGGNLVSGNIVTISLGPIDGSAIEGIGPSFIPSDYIGNTESGASLILSINGNFSTGDVVAQTSVITKNDALSEPTENFSVLLGALSATNGNSITITNTTVVTDILDLPINELSVTDNASSSAVNSLLTAGIDRITIDFSSNDYSGIDFNLSNFSDTDILKFNRNDGLVNTGNSFLPVLNIGLVNVTSATSSGSMVRDRISYGMTSFNLNSSGTLSPIQLQITGLPSTLTGSNFEFFAA